MRRAYPKADLAEHEAHVKRALLRGHPAECRRSLVALEDGVPLNRLTSAIERYETYDVRSKRRHQVTRVRAKRHDESFSEESTGSSSSETASQASGDYSLNAVSRRKPGKSHRRSKGRPKKGKSVDPKLISEVTEAVAKALKVETPAAMSGPPLVQAGMGTYPPPHPAPYGVYATGPRPPMDTKPYGRHVPGTKCHYCKGEGHFFRACNKYSNDYYAGKVKWPTNTNVRNLCLQEMYAEAHHTPLEMPEWNPYGCPPETYPAPTVPYAGSTYAGSAMGSASEAPQRALPAPPSGRDTPEN